MLLPMKSLSVHVLSMVALFLAGCSHLGTIFPSNRVLTPTVACDQPGTTQADKVFFPDRQEEHGFLLYLPPCYAQHASSAYPTLYWTSAGGQFLFNVADPLIRQGGLQPFIIVMVDIDPVKGYGADTQIVQTVVPYVDAHYRTRPDRAYRSITGSSHGGAIALRAAFRAPGIFGRVADLSGGIDISEQQKFTNWILATPQKLRPEVLISVGDQDGILLLTGYLTAVLDKTGVPYTFIHSPGNHGASYCETHWAECLKWLVPTH